MCRRSRLKRGIRGTRGAALVEMAIVISLLFLLVFGMIDFGLVLRDYLALSQVAREGARTASLTTDDAAVRLTIDTWATSLGLDQNKLTRPVPITRTPPDPGGQVKVTLTYTHGMVTKLFGSTMTLKTSMVMRDE
jgi:Flp pilus assembly protein TadG